MTDNVTDKAVESIVQQWNGGEHILAGKRASELVYGAGRKPNQKLLGDITQKATGIEQFITPPADGAVEEIGSATETEDAPYPSNVSSEQAKDEQDAIDARLKAGREARERHEAEPVAPEPGNSTRMNPKGSDKDHKDGSRRKARA
jgi:hypothetical protein